MLTFQRKKKLYRESSRWTLAAQPSFSSSSLAEKTWTIWRSCSSSLKTRGRRVSSRSTRWSKLNEFCSVGGGAGVGAQRQRVSRSLTKELFFIIGTTRSWCIILFFDPRLACLLWLIVFMASWRQDDREDGRLRSRPFNGQPFLVGAFVSWAEALLYALSFAFTVRFQKRWPLSYVPKLHE